jgi:hypothetical protein
MNIGGASPGKGFEMAVTIISGGRGHRNPDIVDEAVKASGFTVSKVIEGGQRTWERRRIVGGVDYFAKCWGDARGIPVQTIEADWRKHGKAAGPIRNTKMLDGPEQLIAIPDAESRGTWDMVRKAEAKGLAVYVHPIERV